MSQIKLGYEVSAPLARQPESVHTRLLPTTYTPFNLPCSIPSLAPLALPSPLRPSPPPANNYYVSRKSVDLASAQCVARLLAAGQGEAVVKELVDISREGRAPKQATGERMGGRRHAGSAT